MKVKNVSASIINLRSKKGKDSILPLEIVTLKKENEEFAKLLIADGKLKEVATRKPAATATTTDP